MDSLAICCALTLPVWVAHLLPTFSLSSIPLRALLRTPSGARYVLKATELIGALKFLHHLLVLARAIAGLRRGVEGSVEYVVHDFDFLTIEAAPLHRGLKLRPLLRILLAHLHVAPREHLIELLPSVLAAAILHDLMDQLIDARRLREFCDLVAQSLGFVF